MRYKIRDGVVLLDIHGALIIAADENARKYCAFLKEVNETGAYIFNELESGLSIDEIADKMMDEFSLNNRNELLNDIKGFVHHLEQYNYIESTITIDYE